MPIDTNEQCEGHIIHVCHACSVERDTIPKRLLRLPSSTVYPKQILHSTMIIKLYPVVEAWVLSLDLIKVLQSRSHIAVLILSLQLRSKVTDILVCMGQLKRLHSPYPKGLFGNPFPAKIYVDRPKI